MNIDYDKLMVKVKKHLWGPLGSVGLHILMLILLVQFSVGVSTEKAPEVEVTMMDNKETVLDKPEEIKPPEKEKIEKPTEQEVITDRPTDATVSTMDVPADAPGSGAGNMDGVGIGSGDPSLAAGFEVAVSKSPLVMRGLYAQRTAGGRKGALSAFGGSGRGEEAVMRALRWLKAKQDSDGSWKTAESTDPAAMAGLALLCFLAHGETPASEEFGQTVEKAMKFVVSEQKSDGSFGRDYTHGICTYAISEAFGLTKIIALKESMDKGIQLIIDGQQSGGGYDYKYAKGDRWDLSVAGWQFQALKAAKMAGCSNEKLEESVHKATDFLRKTAHELGAGFGYASAKSTPSMTGAGTLCLQLMGKADCPEVKDGLRWMNSSTSEIFEPKWNSEGGKGKNPVYAWYYITQAKFQSGGDDWKKWNPKFSTAVIRSQIVEGKLGHWEGGDHGKDVYTTTLCCLMLEVYYRFLPTFKEVAATPVAPATATKSDDVVVDIK